MRITAAKVSLDLIIEIEGEEVEIASSLVLSNPHEALSSNKKRSQTLGTLLLRSLQALADDGSD